MTTATSRPATRTGASSAVVLMGAVVAAILGLLYATGSGAAQFSGISPGDGAVLAAAPSAVTVSFSDVPEVAVAHVAVVGPDGASVTRGLPTVVGSAVVQPVTATAPGRYRIAYHVEIAEGSPVSGLTDFTVGTAGAPTAPPATAAEPAAHQHVMRRDLTTLAFVLLDLALVAVLVVVLLPRRRAR